MSVAIDFNTVTAPLWSGKAKITRSDGQFLEATLVSRGVQFTDAIFDPCDETTLYASCSDGAVYVFALRGNSVKLFASLDHSLTAMACLRAVFVCATEDDHLVWIDRATSRTLQSGRTPHTHSIRMFAISPTAVFLATLSRHTLALWDTAQFTCRVHSLTTAPNVVRDFMSVHVTSEEIFTVEYTGRLTSWDATRLVPKASVMMEVRPRSSVLGDGFIAIGAADALVGFVRTTDLSSIGAVQLTTAPAATRAMVAVNGGALLACELTDGTLLFLVTKEYAVAFAMAAPYSGTVQRRTNSFTVSGPSFAVFLNGTDLKLFHLPTVRQFHQRRVRWAKGGSVEASHESRPPQLLPFLQESGAVRVTQLPSRSSAAPPGSTGEENEKEKNKKDDVTHMAGADESPTTSLALLPNDRQVAKWIRAKAISTTPKRESVSNHSENANAVRKGGKQLELRPTLDKASRAANILELRRLLLRYGVFPAQHRPLTWRFLLHLPERRRTAPQFAALLEKGTHEAVPFLMTPFPITERTVRAAMMKTLSILAWHAPHFAVVHFIPMLVFPFLQVYNDDTQAIVETVLMVMSNWGQEFSAYYPQPPVSLVTLLAQLLRTEDAELYEYLEQRGVMADVWGFEPLRALCTDTLSSAEWLQVMDHAFFNVPIWLFLFHIRWLVHIRAQLMKLNVLSEISEALLTPHPVDVNRIIAETYHLQKRCPQSELVRPYLQLHTFTRAMYPNMWCVNAETTARKMAEVEEIIAQRASAESSRGRLDAVHAKLNEAEMLEQVLVEQKRAEMAARFAVAGESRIHEVMLERQRQRQREEANGVRLLALQQQVETAARLEELGEEARCVSGQVEEMSASQQREARHWRCSELLTDTELQRLEEAARKRLAAAMRVIDGDDAQYTHKKNLNKTPGKREESVEKDEKGERHKNPLQSATGKIKNEEKKVEPVADRKSEFSRESIEPSVPLFAGEPFALFREIKNSASRATTATTVGMRAGGIPANMGPERRSPSSTASLYDNLLPQSVDARDALEHVQQHSHSHPLRVQQVARRRMVSELEERSSAGSVLLRPREPDAYRLPRRFE